ncbi:hypothetical protein DB347_20005 [Opitutaceae bacterium EW11]|nr:hypothetical protein DB347_20005 [Opitutaceae bacterium EW11]
MKTCLTLLTVWLLVVSAALPGEIVARGAHPRLFYTAERMAALKERIQREPGTAQAWEAIRAAAEQSLQKPTAGRETIDQLVLAYRMTGDARFAGPVRKYLLRETSRQTWSDPEMMRRSPPWHADLGVARVVFSTAAAFDGIHDVLSPDERRQIAARIVKLGILPTLDDWVLSERRIHSLDTMGHNWWSACVFTAGIGALAVTDEEPRAAGWLREISSGSVEWFAYAGSLIENKPANFDPAGGFYESVNYASFAVAEYLLFRLAWTNALETAPAEIPELAKVGDFFVNVAYPNRGPIMTLNFGDGSIHADGSRPLALLWALGQRSPSYAWYLNSARKMSYREGLDRSSPLGLVYFPSDAELSVAPSAPPLPLSTVYSGMGWAMLRSSWDKDATLIGLKAGYTWNHSHADAGSFILFHRGENLLVDSGNCGYGRPEYDGYYRQSAAHNVVLFNGRAENPEDTYTGSKFPGSVSHLVDTGDFRYLLADATGPTSREFNRNYRHLLWVGDVVLIVDDVESFEPGQFSWLLHTSAPAVRHGLDLQVTQGAATVLVRPLFPETFPDAGLPTDYPEKMRLVEKTGLKDHDPDAKVPYYAFEPSELTRRTKFVTALTLVSPENERQLPQLERLTDKDVIGVRVRQNGHVTDVYFNLLADGRIRHRNANNILGGWESDALILAIGYPETGGPDGAARPSRVFVADGSYLRRSDQVALASLSKVFATWTAEHDEMRLIVQGQPVMNVRIASETKPKKIVVNGREGAGTYDAADRTVRVSVRE